MGLIGWVRLRQAFQGIDAAQANVARRAAQVAYGLAEPVGDLALAGQSWGPSGSSGGWPRLLTGESIAVPIVAYASARRTSA
jgi:hypothetical protein